MFEQEWKEIREIVCRIEELSHRIDVATAAGHLELAQQLQQAAAGVKERRAELVESVHNQVVEAAAL
jgi:hypothetical protein